MGGRARLVVAGLAVFGLLGGGVSAAGAVTPGWECVPATAGQAVVSGGTGAAPSCEAGATAVLAPTYVASGVGGKPTVQFASVNVQILDGAGQTESVNGTGNVVIGYDEDPSKKAQTGSHALILGSSQSWTKYGQFVGGYNNTATGAFGSVLGASNSVSGSWGRAPDARLHVRYRHRLGNDRAAHRSTPGKIYNLGGGGNISMLDVLDLVRDELGEMRVRSAPGQMGDARNTAASIELARAELGYEPTHDLMAGLREQIDWHRGFAELAPAAR